MTTNELANEITGKNAAAPNMKPAKRGCGKASASVARHQPVNGGSAAEELPATTQDTTPKTAKTRKVPESDSAVPEADRSIKNKAKKTASDKPSASEPTPAATAQAKPAGTKAGETKADQVLKRLRSAKGASVAMLIEATG